MNSEGKVGWEEIVDSRLEGIYDVQELDEAATLVYRCINRLPQKRPSMGDIVQVLTQILKSRHSKKWKNQPHNEKPLSTTAVDEVSIDVGRSEGREDPTLNQYRRGELMDSTAGTFEV